jgi:hypothetical protein
LTGLIARELKAIDVIDVLSDLFILRGVPGHIRSNNPLRCVAQFGRSRFVVLQDRVNDRDQRPELRSRWRLGSNKAGRRRKGACPIFGSRY